MRERTRGYELKRVGEKKHIERVNEKENENGY